MLLFDDDDLFVFFLKFIIFLYFCENIYYWLGVRDWCLIIASFRFFLIELVGLGRNRDTSL